MGSAANRAGHDASKRADRRPVRARRTALIVAALAVTLTAAGCGSSSSKSSSATTTTTGPATTVSPNASCPFDGSTVTQSKAGDAGSTTLDKVTPSTAGCIDNVVFDFSPTLASSVTAYESPAPAGGGAVLVVTLQNAKLGSGITPGTKVDPKNLNYVSEVQLTSSAGDIVWHITLDKQRPFLVNVTKVPAEIQISVG